MNYLIEDCVRIHDDAPTGILVGGDDLVMLAALARECGLDFDSDVAMAQIIVRAVARGYFTVVREYEQIFEGLDVVLSPYQWEEWVRTGKHPAMSERLEAIRDLRNRLNKLEKSVESMLR